MKLLHGGSHVLGQLIQLGLRAQFKLPICFSLGAILLLLSLPSHAVFTTPGSFEVGPDGSANYTIPIQVPPGTGGMAPQLSLSYSSSGGNGLLGMGWSLEGLSQIGRCGKTIAQDGVRGGVNFDANDKFCLDGQRLISTGGTYGANGTEYRTELANFAKIISYGTAGTGPAWFKVWTKGGQILEYGNTEDSRIEASGKPTAMLWGVNKISDTKGNYITVTYVEDNANGESYISRVDYTGNATTNLTPYASVRFSYETRADTSTDYFAGSVVKNTKRISNIKTYTGEVVVKDYQFTYGADGTYSTNTSNQANGSLLRQVKECDGGATSSCQKPTMFTWTVGAINASTFGAAQSWPSGRIVSVGDVNGDGRADVLYDAGGGTGTGTSRGTLYVAFSTGSGFSGAYNTGIAGSTFVCTSTMGGCLGYDYTPAAAALGDVNGDGLADIVVSSGVYLSAGNSFSGLQSWPSGRIVSVGDVNGDGRADVLYDAGGGTGTGTSRGTLYVAFSTGSGFSGAYNTGIAGSTFVCTSKMGGCLGYDYTPAAAALGDFSGDGLSDLVSGNTVSLALSSAPDLITQIIGGYYGSAIQLSYKKLSDTGMYQADSNAAYPVRDMLPVIPMYVVNSITSAGVATNYSYGGLKADLNGRGSLGFRWVKITTPDADSVVTSYYRQDYPFIGLPSSTEKRQFSTNTLLSSSVPTYANVDITTGSAVSKFPNVSQSVEKSYELDGSLVSETTTTNQYDSYGNVTQVTVSSGDGYVKTTTSTYSNDAANWLLGRLLKSVVTSTTPN